MCCSAETFSHSNAIKALDTNVTALIRFTMFILGEKEKLFRAIRKAKNAQAVTEARLRASETVVSNGGYGYRFNAEGNQVMYKCDVRKVTSINYDRNVVRNLLKELNAKSDAVSADIDRCVVNATVDYTEPFDVNASFGDIFENWLERKTA